MSTGRRVMRIFWGMASQVFASAISLALTIFTARAVNAEEYGVFSLALTAAFFATGLIRSLTSEVLVFRHSSASGQERERLTSAALSASVVLGLVTAVTSLVAGLILSQTLWFLLAAAILGLVLQDNVRFALMAQGRSRDATLLDAAALAATVGLLVVATHFGGINTFVMAWGGAAWIAAIVGVAMLRPKIRFDAARQWVGIGGHQAKFFAGDFLVTNVVSTVSVFFIALLLGAAAAGQIRAASMLVLPILLLTRGMILAVASEANRLVADGKISAVRNLGIVMSGSSVLVAAAWIPIVMLLPSHILVMLLGDSADGAAAVFPYVAIATAAAGLAAGPNIILKAAGQVRTALLGKFLALPFALGGVVALSMLAGVAGSQLGLALGELTRSVWGLCWAHRWLKSAASSDSQLPPNKRKAQVESFEKG